MNKILLSCIVGLFVLCNCFSDCVVTEQNISGAFGLTLGETFNESLIIKDSKPEINNGYIIYFINPPVKMSNFDRYAVSVCTKSRRIATIAAFKDSYDETLFAYVIQKISDKYGNICFEKTNRENGQVLEGSIATTQNDNVIFMKITYKDCFLKFFNIDLLNSESKSVR